MPVEAHDEAAGARAADVMDGRAQHSASRATGYPQRPRGRADRSAFVDPADGPAYIFHASAYREPCADPGQARASASRPADLRDRFLQLPLPLLHARGGFSQRVSLPRPGGASHFRRDRADRADHRASWRGQGEAHGRRAAPEALAAGSRAQSHPGGGNRGPGAHHQRVPPRAVRAPAAGRRSWQGDRQPGLPGRGNVCADERPRSSPCPCSPRHRGSRPPPGSSGSRSTPWSCGGINDHQVLDMVRHFRGTGHVVRFIEFMDVGNRNGWRPELVVPSREILDAVSGVFPLEPVAPAYRGEVASRYRFTGRAGGDRLHFLREPAVLQRLHPRQALRGGETVHVPVCGHGFRPSRSPAQRCVGRRAAVPGPGGMAWAARIATRRSASNGQDQRVEKVEMYHIGG